MLKYLVRRILYAIPIIFGVMLITFVLFYVVQTPDKMARRILGQKASQQAIQNWLHNRGYDKPVLFNTKSEADFFDSQFFHHIASLAKFDFGVSDATGERVSVLFKQGAIPSLLITVPSFIIGFAISISISLFLVFVRNSRVDTSSVFITVATMSFPITVYVILGQWLIAVETSFLPAFGFDLSGFSTLRFLILPVMIAVFSELGGEVRLYRAIFLEEIGQDYVRTAQAKGVSSERILFVHVLKNGMIPIITLVVASLPFLIMGTLILENFFGIPGLGNLTVNAIRTADFSVVRASVYLGSLLYLLGLILTDVCYALVDPKIRFQ